MIKSQVESKERMMKKMKDRENSVYEKLRKLKNGSREDILLGFECERLLSDRFSKYTLEEKIEIIEKKLENQNIRD